jgi:hypothetical protein
LRFFGINEASGNLARTLLPLRRRFEVTRTFSFCSHV